MKQTLHILNSFYKSLIISLAGLTLTAHGIAQDEALNLPPLPPVAGAEIGEKVAKAAQSHPAVGALSSYLKASISNNHRQAVQFIDPTSLETFKFRTLNAVRTQLDAVTLEGSKRSRMEDILNELGFDTMEQMTETAASDFYVKVNDRQVATNLSANVTPVDSVKIRVIGLATEDVARTVHFVTRTSHLEDVMLVSNLRLTSMIKVGQDWKVSFQAQQPRLEPLSDEDIKEKKSELENDPELKRLEKILESRRQEDITDQE